VPALCGVSLANAQKAAPFMLIGIQLARLLPCSNTARQALAGFDMAGFNSLPEDLAIKVLGQLSLYDR
jgi:hypothetical protein